MSERDQYGPGQRPEGAVPPTAQWQDDTTPGLHPAGDSAWSGAGASAVGTGTGSGSGARTGAEAGTAAGDPSTTNGSIGTGAHGHPGQNESYYTSPQYSTTPVTVRRPDVLAALLLVLAGIAAGISLLLDWITDDGRNGLDLVKDGFDSFETLWEPPVAVLAGGVLLLLGLLSFVPARSHKTLGVLAMLAAVAATCAVVALLSLSRWTLDAFDIGFWFAVAAAALGFLGAVKAMVTGPKVR